MALNPRAFQLPPLDEPGVPEMLGAVGVAMLTATRSTSDIEGTLAQLASAYERDDLRVSILPTMILIDDPVSDSGRTGVYSSNATPFRLDQAGAIEDLVRSALVGTPAPASVIERIREIGASAPRFGAAAVVAGHVVLTIGFGLTLNPTPSALPVYAILGLLVGVIVVATSRLGSVGFIVPVVTAFAATLLTGLVATPLVADDPLRLVAPALISFLPGLVLTIAAVELTSHQVVSGASRLVFGLSQLALLAFGVFAAVSVLNPSPATGSPTMLGHWAPWLGVVLTGVGFSIFAVAPPRALPWVVLALTIAYAAQSVGNALFGPVLSGFVGAAVVVPCAYLLRRLPSAPPASVMLTCAYWLLVPGALGFIGFSEASTGGSDGTELIVQTLSSLVSIALGMIVGAAIAGSVGDAHRRRTALRQPS